MALLTRFLNLFKKSSYSSPPSKATSATTAVAPPTCEEPEEAKSTVLKRRTAKHDTDSKPSEEPVTLDGYDPELTEMQTCIDDKSARVAHESSRRQQAQEEFSSALDNFLDTAKKTWDKVTDTKKPA